MSATFSEHEGNLIRVQFSAGGLPPIPAERRTPRDVYGGGADGHALLSLEEFNCLVDPDLLPLADDPDFAVLTEGIFATLVTGYTTFGGTSLPLVETELAFAGSRYRVVTERLDDRCCVFFRRDDWQELKRQVLAFLEDRGLR